MMSFFNFEFINISPWPKKNQPKNNLFGQQESTITKSAVNCWPEIMKIIHSAMNKGLNISSKGWYEIDALG